MFPFLKKIFDCIFPPSAETILIESLTQSDVKQLFQIQVKDITSLSRFDDARIRALVHEAKFHGNKKSFEFLGKLFEKYFSTSSQHFDFIIPVPLSSKRLRTRGYNQVLEIVKNSSLPKESLLVTDILLRIRDTKPQTEFKREKRLTNLHDAFGVVEGERLNGKHILIVDDVSTTGTTLHTAKNTLLPYSPASITCIALAH